MKSNRLFSWTSTELFFIFGVLVSASFGVLSSEIAVKLKLTQSEVGLLSGVFFITYAVSQLVLGILISRVPARLVLGFAALVAGAGALIFSMSDGLVMALIGEAVMGIGVSSSFVGVIYVLGREYGNNFAFMSSLSLSLVNVSAASLEMSSAFLPLLVDFRMPFRILAALFVIDALLMFALVGGQSPATSSEAKSPLSEAFTTAVSSGQFWVALVFYCGLYGTLLAYGDLWNIQFQMKFFHHTVQQSAVMNSMIALGLMLGALVVGTWAAKAGFVLPARFFALLTFACLLLFVLVPLPAVAAGALMFVIGCGFSSYTLGLVALQQHLPFQAVPLATALVATAACIFGGVVQPLIGIAIGSRHRTVDLLTFIHSSNNPDFNTSQHGLVWLLACVLLAAIASFRFRPAPSRPLAVK